MKNKSESTLLTKRQSFRKEIRRQQLQQKFRKIRVTLYEQYQSSPQNEQMKSKIQQTIDLITMRNYYFVNGDRSEKVDKQQIDPQIQYFLNLHQMQLNEPDSQMRRVLQHEAIKNKINQRWCAIYKWQEQCGQIVQKIITSISKSWSPYSYKAEILQFILQTVSFLNYGNKIRQMRRISTKQIDQKYFVGEPEKCYRSILRKYCQNLLTNFTACDDDTLLLPFLSHISKVIKVTPDFALIYHNIFLTNHITCGEKLSIFKDFIELLQANPTSMRDNDAQYIKILYLAYGNEPSIIKINFNTQLKSIQLNYRCLNIIDNYLGAFTFKIQECYGQDPHKQQYATIIEIALILECIFKEQTTLVSKLPQKQNIIKFIINRLKQTKSVPEIKCCYYILKCLGHLSICQEIFMEISYHFPVLDIELLKVFDKFFDQIFLEKGIQQQEGNRLTSQIEKLQLECIKQTVRIFKISAGNEEMSFKYLNNKLVRKLMRICQFWIKNRGIKSLRFSKDSCIEIFCLIIHNLLRYNFHESEFNIEFEPVDILIGEFFFSQQQSSSLKSNLFHLIEIELSSLLGNREVCNYTLMEMVLPMLGGLLRRVFSQLEWQLSQQQGILESYSNIDRQKFHLLQRNKWFLICKEYIINTNIANILSQLLYNSNIKFISFDLKIQSMISQILQLSERIGQIARSGTFTDNNNSIELQK